MQAVKLTKGRLFGIIVVCCSLLYILLNHKWVWSLSTSFLSFHGKSTNQPIILLYTSWNVEQYWSDLYPEKLDSHLNDVRCPIRDCKISYDKNILDKASAVLFHGQDLGSDNIYSPESLLQLKRPANQIWVWVNQESPSNVRGTKAYNGVFNWTATYHRKSDIFLPYGCYVSRKNERYLAYRKEIRRIIRNKTGLIAWAVSDCDGSREKYVLELQDFVNITVFGKCRTKFKKQDICISETEDCSRKLAEFKFYLAFENSFCDDYVTEKYWKNALEHGSVPIVFGKNYDAKVAVPGSFINVNKFKTVKELAQYIMFLDENDEHYAKYFEWKRKYKIIPVTDLMCSVCQKLHKLPMQRKIYQDLGEFWNKDRHCVDRKDIVKYSRRT